MILLARCAEMGEFCGVCDVSTMSCGVMCVCVCVCVVVLLLHNGRRDRGLAQCKLGAVCLCKRCVYLFQLVQKDKKDWYA